MRHLPAAVTSVAFAALVLAGCGDTDSDRSAAQGLALEPSVASSGSPTARPTSASVTPSPRPVASEFRAKAAPSESIRTPAVSSARSPEAKPAASPRPKPSRSTAAASAPGAYLDYAAWNAKRASYSSSDVVLFFHASWCPKCRDTEASAKAGMPAGLTLVKVDYDAANDLRKKYGVTLQHTFVQIDEGGNALKKWVGTYDDNGVAWVKAQTV